MSRKLSSVSLLKSAVTKNCFESASPSTAVGELTSIHSGADMSQSKLLEPLTTCMGSPMRMGHFSSAVPSGAVVGASVPSYLVSGVSSNS